LLHRFLFQIASKLSPTALMMSFRAEYLSLFVD
jgi:hypothetical protein